MRTISVIWTRYTDITARLFRFLTGKSYTHTAISLDDGDSYYSFCFRGFSRESLAKYRRRGVTHSLQLRLEVPEEVYRDLWERLAYMKEHTGLYRYTKLGVILALLRIPFRRYHCYFCSQFVAELLQSTGAARISRPACLCLPHHLLGDLEQSPCLVETLPGIV